ncbi:hypothetical protein Nepgr_026492 [Nepenthes gracilis]|uniref:Uncharacterized protein n=1 Tax=Nepenthes gracilis TaxID=150966 RepID=A0AAD3T942_NEPGR|nr:hypothetical protein Nepgr_026492 [Nepenthes gracilis]
MVTGWRRAFCTSFQKDNEPKFEMDKQKRKHPQKDASGCGRSPRFGSRFGFFSPSSGSNPSTPRLQTPLVSSPNLRCQEAPATAAPPSSATATTPILASPAQGSPTLRCKTGISPRFFQRSNPSSPSSPSTLSLLKNSLRFAKIRCGLCVRSVKSGQGTAIFTAECSHAFHFPCLAAHVGKHGGLVCPVCNSSWKEAPLLPVQNQLKSQYEQNKKFSFKQSSSFDLKVYNDDEPLMSPTAGIRFNPIPESDENDDGENEAESGAVEFQGFFGNPSALQSKVRNESINYGDIKVRISADAAVIGVERNYETYAVVMKVSAPPAPANASRRAFIDLVTVLDVGGSMTMSKLQMLKRAMRLVISSLSSNDRLSIIVFSACSKRLLPLKRMTSSGKRSARRIIDALVCSQGSCANDALKKAAKVIEDRRERNPFASIMLLSDGHDDNVSTRSTIPRRHWPVVSFTRFSHLEIPVLSLSFGGFNQEPYEKVFAKCVSGLLSIVVLDLRLHLSVVSGSGPVQISAAYSCTCRPGILSSRFAKLGDLRADEEREILLELKVPPSSIGSHHVLSVRSCYKDPLDQELIYGKDQALLIPRPHSIRSSEPSAQRLRRLFTVTRAVAESRRSLDRNDLSRAHHLLSSARALLMQSGSASADEWLRGVEAEIEELQIRRQRTPQGRRMTTGRDREEMSFLDDKGEPLTPTSAWKAAERLAKVAMMRKSMNRVSDLHGFENARF